MGKYTVIIETKEGADTLDITADNIIEMYNQVTEQEDFIRIIDFEIDE